VANILEHRKFVFCRAGSETYIPNGSNKVWEILLFDNNDVETRFGKIGTTLQTNTKTGVGRKFFDSKIKEKTTKKEHYDGECYREIKTLDVGTVAEVSSKTDLRQLAVKQIAADCKITAKLVSYFSEVNAHQIYQASGGKITYDVSSGTFKTPIGIVVQENVDEARKLLHDTLAPYVQNADFKNMKFIRALEQYLMLIPKDIGRSFDAQAILGTQAQVIEQNQVLDALDASIKSVLTSNSNSQSAVKTKVLEDPQIFNVKMSVIDDQKEIHRIQQFFDRTRNRMHISSRLRITTAYSVDINTMNAAFAKDGAILSNIWELWHGTKASNCLSLLKRGFIIPPSNAAYCTGRMFGNGVYFSDQSTKSLNYAMNYWGGKDEGRYFMFLNQVAMGKYQVPRSSVSSQPDRGYDSYFAKGSESGVANNEMIVFRTSQIRPTHLIEFGR
jgi:poly [ADP-ribose] polymerase